MIKRIYAVDQSGDFDAIFEHETFNFLNFIQCKEIVLQFTPRFEVEVESSAIDNFHILTTNISTILVDDNLKKYLDSKYPNQMQFISVDVRCIDKMVKNKYFLLNALHSEKIIDEEKTEKYTIEDSFFYGGQPVLIKDALKEIGIGRHNKQGLMSYLFFSDQLVLALQKNNFVNGFIFE